jgi:hypothetical protein
MKRTPVNSLADLIRQPERVKEILRMLDALERLEVIVDGKRGAIRFSGGNAVVSLDETGISASPAPTPSGPTLHPETIIWRDRGIDAGGTFGDDSIDIADALIRAINAASFNDKIIYLLPFLGSNLAAARVPLRDRLNVGISTNNNFVEADFTEATGLQGNGTDKSLDILFAPDDVEDFTGLRAIGFGWWETNVVNALASDAYVMGSHDGSQNQVIFRSLITGGVWDFQAGYFSGPFVASNDRGRGHHYGQKLDSTNRKLFLDAAQEDSDTTSDNTALGSNHIALFAFRDTPANGGIREHYAGRCGVAYVTNGQLTDQEVADLDSILRTYLMDPTGRLADPTVTYDGGDSGDEFTDILDGGDAGDEFTTIFDGNPLP